MVFESLVVDVLNRFLGDYVVNLDSSQLKLGIWGGKQTPVLGRFSPGSFLARSRKLAEAMLTAASRQIVPPDRAAFSCQCQFVCNPGSPLALQS